MKEEEYGKVRTFHYNNEDEERKDVRRHHYEVNLYNNHYRDLHCMDSVTTNATVWTKL